MRRLCITCHTVAEPRVETGGSGAFELLLWVIGLATFLFGGEWVLLAAIIYSTVIRRMSRTSCPECGSTSLITPTTPRAREILGDERAAAEAEEAAFEAEDVRNGRYILIGILAVFAVIAMMARR